MGVRKELCHSLPCAVAFAREIGAVDTVLNALLTRASPETASAATSVYGVGFTSAASEFLSRYAFETHGKLVRATGSVAHGY